MAAPIDTGLVFADLEKLDDEGGRLRYELIDGELFVTPKAVLRHQSALLRIGRRLLEHGEAHGGAAWVEPGVYYDDRNYVIPDVVFVTADTLAALDPRHVDAVPDLVVEVSSPTTRRHDLVRKRRLYEARGVPEYWFVDLDADRIEVYRLAGNAYRPPLICERGDAITPPHLPGLVVAVDDALGPAEE
ncbi:MAG: Uma2 family endonuclease [Egibacteraceae bacterium]